MLAFNMWMFGEGSLHVMAPDFEDATVSVDGQELATLSPGQHRTIDLAQGAHTVTLTTASGATVTHELDVSSGFWQQFTPVEGQCVAVVEATDYFYTGEENAAGLSPLPTLEERHRGPFDVSSSYYYSVDALPSTINEDTTVRLVQNIPCEMMELSSKEIVVGYLGWEGYEPEGWF